MRVTDKMIFERAAQYTGRAREQVERAVAENATGLRVRHPGDDPAASGIIVRRKIAHEKFVAVAEGANRAADELGMADSALSDLLASINRGYELGVQMANATNSASDRAAAALEVDQLFNSAIRSLNTEIGGRYLFGGVVDSAPPFDPTGVYSGSTTTARDVEVAPGIVETASLLGNEVALGASGGPNILTALTALRTALANDDTGAVSGALANLNASVKHLSDVRGRTGAMQNMFETAAEAGRLARDSERDGLADLTDVDVFEAASRLAQAQRALDAALTSAARSFDLTLLRKLG